MRILDAPVVANTTVMPGVSLLRLLAPPLAAGISPGQMVLLRGGPGSLPALRVALPLHRVRGHEVAFLVPVQGSHSLDAGGWSAFAGHTTLAACRPGDVVTVQGPIGRGFRMDAASRSLLLVAQDLGVAPLVALAEAGLSRGLAVTLLAGAGSAAGLLPASHVPAEVEYRVATLDGSLGQRGTVLDLLAAAKAPPPLLWADQVFAAGRPSLYAGLQAAIAAARFSPGPGFAQGLAHGPLGCGLGACLGCAVESRHGLVYLCKHGPVLDLRDMVF